ncbi:MAG: hypothetical protein ACI9G1_005527 [Pirellulaceae bacterium]
MGRFIGTLYWDALLGLALNALNCKLVRRDKGSVEAEKWSKRRAYRACH